MTKNQGTKVRIQKGESEENPTTAEEEPARLDPVETEPEAVDALEEQLEAARKEASETYDRLLRTTAEFDNYKKRTQREIEGIRKFANEGLLSDLLSVVDNLERAVASGAGETPGDESILQGVTMTLSELLRILEKYGVQPFTSVGEPFDPAFHQAFLQEETDRHPDNTVVNEIQKGYTLHDRLLRPAMVVVSKAPAPDDPEG